jgi:uracil-DNA glycosylase
MNIFKELMDDVHIDTPQHGSLEYWADQGVLLLNTVLTVRQGEANSHARKGWEQFTDAVIEKLNNEKQGLVFLLWGNPAANKAGGVDDERHTIIRSSHPSPLGATKTSSPFLGSRCFSRANKALSDSGQTPIDWNVR